MLAIDQKRKNKMFNIIVRMLIYICATLDHIFIDANNLLFYLSCIIIAIVKRSNNKGLQL